MSQFKITNFWALLMPKKASWWLLLIAFVVSANQSSAYLNMKFEQRPHNWRWGKIMPPFYCFEPQFGYWTTSRQKSLFTLLKLLRSALFSLLAATERELCAWSRSWDETDAIWRRFAQRCAVCAQQHQFVAFLLNWSDEAFVMP